MHLLLRDTSKTNHAGAYTNVVRYPYMRNFTYMLWHLHLYHMHVATHAPPVAGCDLMRNVTGRGGSLGSYVFVRQSDSTPFQRVPQRLLAQQCQICWGWRSSAERRVVKEQRVDIPRRHPRLLFLLKVCDGAAHFTHEG